MDSNTSMAICPLTLARSDGPMRMALSLSCDRDEVRHNYLPQTLSDPVLHQADQRVPMDFVPRLTPPNFKTLIYSNNAILQSRGTSA